MYPVRIDAIVTEPAAAEPCAVDESKYNHSSTHSPATPGAVAASIRTRPSRFALLNAPPVPSSTR